MAILPAEVLQIEIILKGGGAYLIEPGSSAEQFTREIEKDLPYPAMGVIIDNNLKDLHQTLDRSCTMEVIDITSETGNRIYRTSAVYILIKACRDIFPERQLKIKHSLSNGLFCEFLQHQCNDEEVRRIEDRIAEIVARDLPIRKLVVSKKEAQRIFFMQGQKDKVKLLEYQDKDYVHIHEMDGFCEYFYSYMVPRTGMINKFKLLNYPPGIILQTPEVAAPDAILPYIEQRKLASVYQEAKAWAEMLNTPHVAALNDIIESGNMNDIMRINEALHEKKIASIADQICDNPRIRLVLISGPSSSGKTTFAERLLIQLRVNGRRPVTVSLDNYFVDRDKTPRDENNEWDFEALEALNLELFNDHLQRLIKGEQVELPFYNFNSGHRANRGILTRVPDGEPIIVEGIHGLNNRLTESIPDEQKFKIYVSVLTQLNIDYTNRIPTTDSRLIRRIIRDARTRGYGALETINRWPSVRRGEEKNIFPYQENADIMFNSSLVFELAVLKPLLEKLLMPIGSEYSEHMEAQRLLKFVSYFRSLTDEQVPMNSILREFVGNSCFRV